MNKKEGKKGKPSIGERFKKVFKRPLGQGKKRNPPGAQWWDMEQDVPTRHDDPDQLPGYMSQENQLEPQHMELEINPRNHKMRADGVSKVVIRSRALINGQEYPQQMMDFGLLNNDVGKLHKISANEVEFESCPFAADTVAGVEVLYRYNENSIRKQVKIFLEGGNPKFSVTVDPPGNIIRGNALEQFVIKANYSAFDGDYTVPCPAIFQVVSGEDYGTLEPVVVKEENNNTTYDKTSAIFKPYLTDTTRKIRLKISPDPKTVKQKESQLPRMFENPDNTPVEIEMTVQKADLSVCIQCDRSEVEALGNEKILVWGYLKDKDVPVPEKVEFQVESLLPQDQVHTLDKLTDDIIDPESIPVEQRVFFNKHADCLRWLIIQLGETNNENETSARVVHVKAMAMNKTSETLELKQLSPKLFLELNKSTVKAGNLVIITPYIILPNGKKLPVTRKLYNPAGDMEYFSLSVEEKLARSKKTIDQLEKCFKVMGNTARFNSPEDLYGYKLYVHCRVPFKSYVLKQTAIINVSSPEYLIRPIRKMYYEDEEEIAYEILMRPVNKKDWLVDVMVEDESRNPKPPPFKQILQFPPGEGLARGKYKFARRGNPLEKGGVIKISLADRPEIRTVVRVLAPFQIKLKTKLARFRLDHLQQMDHNKDNFQKEYQFRVKPFKPINDKKE